MGLATVTANFPYPFLSAISAPFIWSMGVSSGSTTLSLPTASKTTWRGDVSMSPEILPQSPCRRPGSVMIAVPQPSAAITAASIFFSARAVLRISDTPKVT